MKQNFFALSASPFLIGLLLLGIRAGAGTDFQLPIRLHHQEHSLSCEAASLKMLLASIGVQVTEDEIIRQMPFDTTPKRAGIWGDPDTAFVGDINGEMGVTGYGIHAKGLSIVASRWAKPTVIENGSIGLLTQFLLQKHPVLIWGYGDSNKKVKWRTPSGKLITAMDDEHVRVVYGFRGNVEAPTHFYLLDSQHGLLNWSAQKLLDNWSISGRSALVLEKLTTQ